MNEVLLTVSEELNVPLVVTDPHLENEDYFDHAHNNASGHKKIAELVKDKLIEEGVIGEVSE